MENVHIREVLRGRTIKSLVYSLWRLPLFIFLFLLLSHVSLLHPIAWMQDTFHTTFTFSTWMYILAIGCINSLVAIVSWKHYTVTPTVHTTRLEKIISVIEPDRLFHAAGHAAAGGTLALCYTGLAGGRFVNLIGSCSSQEKDESECLNEYHIFAVFHGAFVGLLYSIQFFLHQNHYMTFPAIQQPKMFQVQNGRLPLLVKSAMKILNQVKYYYLLYWLFGGIPKHWMLKTLGLLESKNAPVNSIYGLLDAGLLWHVLLSGIIIHSTWTFAGLLYKIYNTEAQQFPVETSFENKTTQCLHETLAYHEQPLVQHLGYQDLYQLAKYAEKRRRQIFSLSQPGGHPHNWNYIVTECLSVIHALTNSITIYNNTTPGPIKHLSGEKTSLKPTDTNSNLRQRYPEILTAQNGLKEQEEKPKLDDSYDRFLSVLKKKPIFAYFLQDVPDSLSRKVFVNAQIQIWALEALSELIAASYTEDSYGVVQKWLPEVLTALLSLQESVDKHFRLATNMARRPPKGTDQSDVALRYALRNTLKTAVYRITDKFADHVEQFKLPPDHMRRLRMFLEHKE